MSVTRNLFCCLFIALFIFISGCVAQKSSTVHNTLKGDNSVTEVMQKSVDLPVSGFLTLSELTDRFSRDLAGEVSGTKIYLDRANIREVISGDVAHFSSYLQNELEASLSRKFQLQIMSEDAEILLGVSFQRYGNQIKIFFKYHSPDFSINKSLDYGIERAKLPRDSLKENLRSKAYQLAANIIEDDVGHKIYVKPLESVACRCVAPFSRAFATMVKTEIVRMHRQIEVVDNKPLNTRSIKKKAEKVKELDSSDAFFADADSVLEGEYVENGNQVIVTLMLKDLEGHLINSCSVDIDRAIIKIPLEDKAAKKLADLTDRKTENNGRTVKITTSRSGDYPVYREGEKIVFFAQVKKPLYLYIYSIDRKGEVSLLYPSSPENNQRKTYPGKLVAIPDENDDYEFFAEPPFGMDAVKIFASASELPLPAISDSTESRSYSAGVRAIGKRRRKVQGLLVKQKQINPKDLVDYYRGLSEQFQIKIFEDSLMVQTRP